MSTDNPSTFPIVPLEGVHNRLPISELVPSRRKTDDSNNANIQPKNQMIWSLYIRALTLMKERDITLPNSYFQLAGIHGYPFAEWAKRNSTVDLKARRYGYCTHSQVLFPTWHRIYALAFEQVLRDDAVEVAKEYNSATYKGLKWTDVAKDLRQPYWDWAENIRDPPQEIFGGDNVKVIGNDGQETEVPNPLLRYHFPENYITDEEIAGETSKDLKETLTRFSGWDTTVRNPDVSRNEDVQGLLDKFKRVGGETRYKTLMMLLSFDTNWEYFSNNGMRFDRAGLYNNSLEAVHDDIHMFAGEGHSLNGVIERAHMTDLGFAAFDPIFWLHHANVDRLLSIWQVIHPEIWVSEGKTREPTLDRDLGDTVDEKSPLEPFYQESGQPWTSDLLRDTAKLGYSYPDFARAGVQEITEDDDTDFLRALKTAGNFAEMFTYVYDLYGYKLKAGETNEAVKTFAEFFGKRQRLSESFEMYDWGIHASFKKFEVKGSFTLVFYFADGTHWDEDGYYIGTVNAFHGLSPEICTNCQNHEEIRQEGYVPLTYLLARSLDWETTHNPTITARTNDDWSHPDQVLKYLQDRKLTCRVDGADSSQLGSLELTLHGKLMRLEGSSDQDEDEGEEGSKAPKGPTDVSGTQHTYTIKKAWTEFRMIVDSKVEEPAERTGESSDAEESNDTKGSKDAKESKDTEA